MTIQAIRLLNATNKPFFLIIEGSKIDSAAHDNDPVYLAHQITEFEKAVKYVKSIAEQHSDWQVIVTADHETGGLTIEDYSFQTEIPLDTDSFTEKQEKRTARALEINVDWSTTGHTKTEVIIAGMGPYTEEILNANQHTDTFSIMRKAIDGLSDPIGSGFYDGYSRLPGYAWFLISITIISIPVTVILIRRRKR
jgi:alkaline phosphatase